MHELKKTLSKILAVACLFVASFNVNAMQEQVHVDAVNGMQMEDIQEIHESQKCCKPFNIICGIASLPCFVLGMYSEENFIQSILYGGFVFLLMFSVIGRLT